MVLNGCQPNKVRRQCHAGSQGHELQARTGVAHMRPGELRRMTLAIPQIGVTLILSCCMARKAGVRPKRPITRTLLSAALWQLPASLPPLL